MPILTGTISRHFCLRSFTVCCPIWFERGIFTLHNRRFIESILAKTCIGRFDDDEREKTLSTAAKNAKIEISRFKGLGEMTAEELKTTTLDKHRRRALRVKIEGEVETDQVISELMGKDPLARFNFIMEHAPKAEALDL